MTKIYLDGSSRCKNCYRLFWSNNSLTLVCNDCIKLEEPEIKTRNIIVDDTADNVRANNIDYWNSLSKLTELLRNSIFFN